MFLDVKELAVRKIRIRKSYAPGSMDYHSGEFKQAGPLEVRASAELVEGQIRITGSLQTKIELVCARCLEPVVEEVSRDFDLFYRPMKTIAKEDEVRLKEGDTEIAFFEGKGLFLADVLAEQVLRGMPITMPSPKMGQGRGVFLCRIQNAVIPKAARIGAARTTI